MSAINRAALREQLWPGIFEIFGSTYSDYEDQYGYVFTTRKSTKAYEEYVMESMFGLAPPKAEGAPIIFDEAAEVWKGRVEMNAYALGFIITREAVNDNQYFDLVPRYTRALKRSMKITKEVRAAAFVDAAFTTSTTGDGKPICAVDHPLRNGEVLANKPAAAADLNETSLEAAIIQIGDFVDERGLKIAVNARRMVVPNSLQFTAERLMKTTGARVGTADNDVAAIHTLGMVPEGYRINNYLSDPAAWFLMTDVDEGMTHWDREPLDLEEGDGSETQTMRVMAYERYAFSCMDPRSIFGVPG
jgi:hypothetical protein